MTMYAMTELVQGFPGRSATHGGLGWSAVTLLRGGGRTVLVDTGHFGMRPLLAARLADAGVAPDDVTDVVLTHAHYDHAANYLLFPAATVHVSAAEVEWAAAAGPTFMPLPELYGADLATNPRVHRLAAGAGIVDGIVSVAAPGHTPGSIVVLADCADGPVLFTGDAAKNRAELLSGDVDMTLDRDASRATVARILGLVDDTPGVLVVPGHDVPMRRDGDGLGYVGTRRAELAAWFGDDLATTRTYDLGGQP